MRSSPRLQSLVHVLSAKTSTLRISASTSSGRTWLARGDKLADEAAWWHRLSTKCDIRAKRRAACKIDKKIKRRERWERERIRVKQQCVARTHSGLTMRRYKYKLK